jgi:SAM-dependent methyltransferase
MEARDGRLRFEELQTRHFSEADGARFAWQTRDPYLSRTERELLDAVGIRAGERLLEVGCGEGGNLELLDNLPAYTVGLDFSSRKVVWATHRKRSVRFVCADATRLPFKEDAFDTILCRDVLHHVFDKRRVCAEMLRVCRASGRVVIVEPNGRNPIMRLLGLIVPAERDVARNSLRRLQEIVESLKIRSHSVVVAQPFPIGRMLFHYKWGFPRLSPYLGRAVRVLEKAVGRLMPSDRWAYLVITLLKGCEHRAMPQE